jgi:hypothetical protein
MPAQLIGAVGLTSTAASAYYVAPGHLNPRCPVGPQTGLREKMRQDYSLLIGQIALLVVVTGQILLSAFPKLAVPAFVPAIFRGTVWFLRGSRALDVYKLGFSELFRSILFGAFALHRVARIFAATTAAWMPRIHFAEAIP